MSKPDRPEFAVPEEAGGRGPIMLGELRSKQHRYPGMLAQFERLMPFSRTAQIFLFPTAEQAERLYLQSGPLTFEATYCTREGVMETRVAEDIWPKPISKIHNKEAIYWTQTSGAIGRLEVKDTFEPGPELDARSDDLSGWFVARRCFGLQILANADAEQIEDAKKYGFEKADVFFELSDGAKAQIQRYIRAHRMSVGRDSKRSGYSISVSGFTNADRVKEDVDAFLILASFASRERSLCSHWSINSKAETISHSIYNFGKFPKRRDREEPLVPRDRELWHKFMQGAFSIYQQAQHQRLLDSAIFALLAKDETLEIHIAHLFSGIQGALLFATQYPSVSKRPQIGVLYRRFLKAHPGLFDDLWPLIDPKGGPPLVHFRNAIVHGEAFSEQHWEAMSYAGQNLEWHLERIILTALGWDVAKSAISAGTLRHYFAYNWQAMRGKTVMA